MASPVGLVFSIVAASLAVFGIRQMMARNVDLVRAHEKNAELAVENERTRFARDLHDILGHSLTVITVKAELANRLLDVDTERARAELADLERLSRDALADVRRAVEGYRELTLPGELARARTALAAAEIEAELPNSTDEVPVAPARAVRVDGARGRHQRDPAQRRDAAARCGWARMPPRSSTTAAGRRTGRCRGGRSAHRQRVDRPARAGRRRRRHGHAPGSSRPTGTSCGWPSDERHPRSGCCWPTTRPWCGARCRRCSASSPTSRWSRRSGRALEVRAGRGRAPSRRRPARRRDARDGRHHRGRPCGTPSRETRVLIVTTFGRPGFLRRAMKAGASGFVVKDTPAAQLADAVRRVHAGLRVVDPVAGHRQPRGGRVAADPTRDRRAAGRARRLAGGRDRPSALPLRGHRAQPPLQRDRQDRRRQPGRGRPHRRRATAGSDRSAPMLAG